MEKYNEYPPFDAEYLANIENLDAAAGRLFQCLEVNRYADNTLVLFSSDNGSYRQASNGALRIDDMMIMGRDRDTVARTHPFTEPDMDYIKNMRMQDYELYDLGKDLSQAYNMIDVHPDAGRFTKLLDEKLQEIQRETYSWEDLPPATGPKRMKTDWVRYTRRSAGPDQ